MDPRKPESKRKGEEPKHEEPPPGTGIGGREFGQVIEPMQAQMASENEGLTEKPAGKAKEEAMKGEKKGGKAA